MAKIVRNEIYGDYRAVERLSERRGGLFRAECVRCSSSQRFLRDELLEEPLHACTKELAVINGIRNALDTDVELEEGESTFEPYIKQIQMMLGDLSANGDASRLFQIATLRMMMELVPYAEKAYREDSRQSNAYGLNAILTQIRELTQDLQAETGQSELIQGIATKILQPTFLQMGQITIDSHYALMREIEDSISPERLAYVREAFRTTLRNQGRSIEALFSECRNRVFAELD